MTSSLPPLNPLLQLCGKRTRDIFAAGLEDSYKDEEKRCVTSTISPPSHLTSPTSARIRLSVKMNDEYKEVKQLPAPLLAQQGPVGPARPKEQRKMITAGRECSILRAGGSSSLFPTSEYGYRHRPHDCANRQHSPTPTFHFHL